ncbi:MAG: hypothetical protein ACREVG_16590, partial [Burkholderiales bacterium]
MVGVNWKSRMVPRSEIEHWEHSAPPDAKDFESARTAFSAFWTRAEALRAKLPPKAQRSADDAAAADSILAAARASRARFLRAHAARVYDALTAGRTRFVRVHELCRRASLEFPGLVPAARELEAESRQMQRDKDGLEIDQGLFFAHVLADPGAGMHLCHAMLLPREESHERLSELER